MKPVKSVREILEKFEMTVDSSKCVKAYVGGVTPEYENAMNLALQDLALLVLAEKKEMPCDKKWHSEVCDCADRIAFNAAIDRIVSVIKGE